MIVRMDKWKIWTNFMMNNEMTNKFTNALEELGIEFEMVNLDAVGS